MSKKRIETCCLVIDADVAHIAGKQDSRGPHCSAFLVSVHGICHRLAWSKTIKAEWDKHQSPFTATWLASMMALSKLRPVADEEVAELREAINHHSSDPNVVKIMLKDVHLIEAALATDYRIASLDDNARGHFTRLAETLDLLKEVLWANPTVETDKVVAWLEKGAPKQKTRFLRKP